MSRFWSDLVSRLNPYVPGEQTESKTVTKLNTNESPFGPSDRVTEAEAAGVKSVPAIVLGGEVLHINFGADLSVLK